MFPSCQFWVANVSCLSHFVYLVVHCLFCIGCFMMGINTWKRFSHFMLTPVCSFICLRSYLLASTVESFSLKTPNQVLSPFAIAHESVYILISGHISFYTKYITWSSILGRLCLSTVMVTPKCGCNEPVVFFQLAFTYWADLFISQTLAFMSSLTWLYRILQTAIDVSWGRVLAQLWLSVREVLTAYLCSLHVPFGSAWVWFLMYYFHLIMDCYWAHLSLWLGESCWAQLIMGSSGHMVPNGQAFYLF